MLPLKQHCSAQTKKNNQCKNYVTFDSNQDESDLCWIHEKRTGRFSFDTSVENEQQQQQHHIGKGKGNKLVITKKKKQHIFGKNKKNKRLNYYKKNFGIEKIKFKNCKLN